MNILISGIDNNGGKTVISAGLTAVMQSLGYVSGVYKPIQTGALDKGKYLVSPDLTFIKMVDSRIITHSTYMFKNKTVPEIASKLENKTIDPDIIIQDYNILSKKTDILIVEAEGGIMTPIADNMFNYILPIKMNIPVVFIVNPLIENINHYLNELNNAHKLGLNVAGVIINKFPVSSDNIDIKTFPTLIEKYSDAKVIGLIRNFRGKTLKINELINEILNGIDIQEVFNIKIAKLNTD